MSQKSPRSALFLGILTVLCPGACSQNVTSSEGGAARTTPSARAPKAKAGSVPASPAPAPRRSSLPRLEGEHHPVFDLTDNRILAHQIRADGLFIPAGYPGFAKYTTFRRPYGHFGLNRRADGRRVALAQKTVSWIEVPLTKAQAQATLMLLRLKSPKAQGLRVEVNGRSLKAVRLGKGWQTAKVELPGQTLKAGENAFQLNWGEVGRVGGVKASGALSWLYLGSRELETIEEVEPAREGKLLLPKDGGLAYYIHPFKGTKLRLRFLAQEEKERCAVEVHVAAAGGAPIEETRREEGLAKGDETETFVDLEPVAGKVARLQIVARGDGCRSLSLREAALVRPGPAPTVKRGTPPKNVLFWLVDNARVDRYTLYNPDTRVKTPVIERLGREGTVFTHAYIQGTESRVSHASIWTGLYPKQHRFISPKARLNRGWVTLSEGVKKGGLITAAWIANGFVSRFWGFGEGWDTFRNTLHKGGGLTAERLADHAIGFVKEKGDRPFYLYVGTIDPHVSWRGRQPWLDEYHPEPYTKGPFKKNVMGPVWDRLAGRPKTVPKSDRKRAMAIYDSTVSYNDHHLGRVLKALEEKGIRDQTMIVVTADHGEEFWEHGRIGHGASCRDTVVNVPLIIHYPPLFGKGVRVERGVNVLDI